MITIDQISNYTALDTAFNVILRKSKASGVDGITPVEFASNQKSNLQELAWAIKSNVFRPDPVKMITIKKNEKEREIGILTCKDRIVSRVIHYQLNKIIDPLLPESSFAFRPQKSALGAMELIEGYISQGYTDVGKTDIQHFFNEINRDLLIQRLYPLVENEEVMQLIINFLSAPMLRENKPLKISGICMGSPLSPVLSNYYLLGIDSYFEKNEEIKYIRYCDDLLFMGKTKEVIKEALDKTKELLEAFFLRTNEKKTLLINAKTGFDFLGFRFDEKGTTATEAAELALEEILEIEWAKNRLLEIGFRIKILEEKMTHWNAYYKNECAGGLLGVLAQIYSGKISEEKILNYRKSLDSEDSEKILLIAEAWESKGKINNGLNEFGRYFNLPEQNFEIGRGQKLFNLYKVYFNKVDNNSIGNLIEEYTEAGEYLIASKLSEYLRSLESFRFEGGDVEVGYSLEEIEIFKKLFFQRTDAFSSEVLVDNERRFILQEKEMLPDVIRRHLAGEITLDSYILDANGKTSMLVLDIDLAKEELLKFKNDSKEVRQLGEEAHQLGKRYLKTAEDMGIIAYLEDSGGLGRHVWLFLDEKITNKEGNNFCKTLIQLTGEIPKGLFVECFPNGRNMKPEKKSASIKVPFGINVRSKKKSFFYLKSSEIIRNWRELVGIIVINQSALIKKNIRSIVKTEKGILIFDDSIETLGCLSPNVRQVMENCVVIRRLVLKAKDTRFLNHFERLSLLYVLGHLGDEGIEFLHKTIAYTMDYKEKTTDYFIKKLPERPISCNKLKEEFKCLGSNECHCKFEMPKGCYPSPVLHAVSVNTYTEEDKKITLPIGRENKETAIIEHYSAREKAENLFYQILEINKKIEELKKTRITLKEEMLVLMKNAGLESIITDYGRVAIDSDEGSQDFLLKV
ncbi:MAG: reverse transcriptase domain-containing protein [Eubacteriaceae bacterium]